METTFKGPLFAAHEWEAYNRDANHRGWQVDIRVHYNEREAPYRIAGRGPILEPEWNVDVTATRRDSPARIVASIYESDPDRVRLLTRYFIEGLRER